MEYLKKREIEGGCGVIGIASEKPLKGYHLLSALKQMKNRGNGKGGGIAACGLDNEFFGVSKELLTRDYILNIAFLEGNIRSELEKEYILPLFNIDHIYAFENSCDYNELNLQVKPPEVISYFVQVKQNIIEKFIKEEDPSYSLEEASDEIVYRNTYNLNKKYYASTGEKRAFVLSHGKNMIVLKIVGYGDDVINYYGLSKLKAYIWIGHHRYPTKGKVWHPGGAHPFIGMHEALVHNGDFANYSSICSYLAQYDIQPLFLTDTEVAILVFDLLKRRFKYPLEYVIEAMAPTTEYDFSKLPDEKKEIYRVLQYLHMHCSPDGPWFFLIATSSAEENKYQLIGITDTSMLRPQVFAIQKGINSIGFSASEKQAIDAALLSISKEDKSYWSQADLYWSARGGSHTDGGAFIFTIHNNKLLCTNKFSQIIQPETSKIIPSIASEAILKETINIARLSNPRFNYSNVMEKIKEWGYRDFCNFIDESIETISKDEDVDTFFNFANLFMDRKGNSSKLKHSFINSVFLEALNRLKDKCKKINDSKYHIVNHHNNAIINKKIAFIDAKEFSSEGKNSLSWKIVELYKEGFKRFVIINALGHRFIGCGLGPNSRGVRIDVYGSSGDYLASGIDGAEIYVHSSAQDQVAQIMKNGTLVIYGDVGQTFMYAAKGGEAYVLGNAAGRPLINAVGSPKVIINGTCLDYLAESFMAGDPINGGGFVIINGLFFDEYGNINFYPSPYPGGNLFSLSSGGAIYIRDPNKVLSEAQLNGGRFDRISEKDCELILNYLKKNEKIFNIPIEKLLQTSESLSIHLTIYDCYRKIIPDELP